MANYTDILIAFWDVESKGAKQMIDLVNNVILNIIVIHFKP